MNCPLKSTKTRISNKTDHLYTDKDNKDISWKYSTSISNLSEEWSSISKSSNDIFLQVPYLRAVENNPPEELKLFYVIFYYKKVVCGIALFQSKLFAAADSIKQEEGEGFIRGSIRNFIASRINFKTLLNGNALLTGEHGFHFDYSIVDKSRIPTFISIANKFLRKEEFDNTRFGMIHIVKDLKVNEQQNSDWEKDSYNRIQVQPNMIFPLREEWKNMDDYLQAMSSKYRKKVKRGLKKNQAIKKMELNLNQIETLNAQIYDLYCSVKDNANFNLFELNEFYFLGLKKELGDDYKLFGYFKDEKLVSFYTLIYNCLLYTSPSPRDATLSRMPSSA